VVALGAEGVVKAAAEPIRERTQASFMMFLFVEEK